MQTWVACTGQSLAQNCQRLIWDDRTVKTWRLAAYYKLSCTPSGMLQRGCSLLQDIVGQQ